MTAITKKSIIMTFLASIMAFSSCSNEGISYGEREGYLRLKLDVDDKTEGTTTRAVENVPGKEDFAVAIYKGDSSTPTLSYDKFSQIESSIGLTVGNYTVKASYGELTKEGFDSPYFVGQQNLTITDGNTENVTVNCALANTKVNILYTDAFKKYFSAYNAEVNSAGHDVITYSQEETRGAYFVPGEVNIYLNVTRQTGTTAKLFAKKFTAEERHEYNITMDIDAGTSTLTIGFDDAIANNKDVTIDVSDDALNVSAPTIKAIGFTAGSTLQVGEGTLSDNVRAYIYAAGGIQSCTMTTSSTYLEGKGWPTEVDLTQATSAQKTLFDEYGLSYKGLGATREQIAIIDFEKTISKLEYVEGKATTEFHLKVVDNGNRVSEGDFILRIETTQSTFEADKEVTVTPGATQVPVNVVYKGDVKNSVTAQYKRMGSWSDLTYTVESTDGTNHKILVQMPYQIEEEEDIRLVNGSRTLNVHIYTSDPVYGITATDGDIWTGHADLTLEYLTSDNTISGFLSGKTVTMQIQKDGDAEWSTPKMARSSNKITLSGLSAGTKYNVRAKATSNGTTDISKTFTFTTESETQLPNNSFEEWTYTTHGENWLGVSTNNWQKYYPWSSDANKGWDTMNLYTTQTGGRYQYNSISGTMETDGRNGTKGAIIRTVGWGNSNAATASPISYNKTPGELYLGSFNSSSMAPDYGMSFVSRPSSVSFYYKYTPCNTDKFVVNVAVENRSNGVTTTLATGSYTDGSQVGDYTLKTVELNYTNTSLKATHLRVEFKSGTDSWSNSGKNDTSLWLEDPDFGNTSTGKFVGSQLYIDDVTLGYE